MYSQIHIHLENSPSPKRWSMFYAGSVHFQMNFPYNFLSTDTGMHHILIHNHIASRKPKNQNQKVFKYCLVWCFAHISKSAGHHQPCSSGERARCRKPTWTQPLMTCSGHLRDAQRHHHHEEPGKNEIYSYMVWGHKKAQQSRIMSTHLTIRHTRWCTVRIHSILHCT